MKRNTQSAPRKPRLAVDLLIDLAGSLCFGIGTQCFSAPNNIAPGGVTGLSILINHLLGVPISLVSFLLNVPLLLLAAMLIGRGFSLRTLKTVAIFSLSLELCERILPAYQGDLILVSLCAGVLSGVGIGVIYARGSSTGGTDLASRLLLLKYPFIPAGKLILAVDGAVLLLSAVVYRSLENALYGLVVIFVSTRMLDSILYGMDTGRVMMVLSDNHEQIRQRINRDLDRGCTILEGRGGYTDTQRPVILCAVRKSQLYELKQLVYLEDPNAFVVALEASEIRGEGFRPISQKL